MLTHADNTVRAATVAGWPADHGEPWCLAVRATLAWTDSLTVQPTPEKGADAVTLNWTAVVGAAVYVVVHDFRPDADDPGGWRNLPHGGAILSRVGTMATGAGLSCWDASACRPATRPASPCPPP